MYVPFGAHFGLYAKKTWLYAVGRAFTFPSGAYYGLYAQETWLYVPWRLCASPFVPVLAFTPRTPGFTLQNERARDRSHQLGPVLPRNQALRPWTSVYVLVRARLRPKTWL